MRCSETLSLSLSLSLSLTHTHTHILSLSHSRSLPLSPSLSRSLSLALSFSAGAECGADRRVAHGAGRQGFHADHVMEMVLNQNLSRPPSDGGRERFWSGEGWGGRSKRRQCGAVMERRKCGAEMVVQCARHVHLNEISMHSRAPQHTALSRVSVRSFSPCVALPLPRPPAHSCTDARCISSSPRRAASSRVEGCNHWPACAAT